MSNPEYTSTYGAALNLASYDQARSESWDARVARLKACILAAKTREAMGFDETAKLARLREQFTALADELEAIEETPVAEVLDDLSVAADQVRADAAPEWADALDAGWSWLLTQDVIQIDAHGSLLVPSSRNPATVYRSNGSCQCPAFMKNSTPLPCAHRGAGLIVERWRENETLERAATERDALAQALELWP